MPIRFKSSALRSSKQTKVKSYIHRVASIDIHTHTMMQITTGEHCVSIATIFRLVLLFTNTSLAAKPNYSSYYSLYSRLNKAFHNLRPGCGICGFFFLWLLTSHIQVVIKKSSNETFSNSKCALRE